MPIVCWPRLGFAALLLALASGCASSLAQPFDSMKSAPITVYRLQNYEPPAAAAGVPGPTSIGGIQIPPQIQQWIDAGAHMLPPGLIPPGLLPGAPPLPPQDNAQRFHNFRILGWMALNDPKQHDEVLDILGHSGNFVTQHDNCMYAEFGFSIAQINQPPADVLVSLSCDQAVAASGFAWPYANTGISADTAKRIVGVIQKAFGPPSG
jgi:hypothetical protein